MIQRVKAKELDWSESFVSCLMLEQALKQQQKMFKKFLACDKKEKEKEFDNEVFVKRLLDNQNKIYEYSVQNPFLLSTMYYCMGMSVSEIADELGVHERTVRRKMDFYGFRRFSDRFSMLVKVHGIRNAMKMEEPTFNPLGDGTKL